MLLFIRIRGRWAPAIVFLFLTLSSLPGRAQSTSQLPPPKQAPLQSIGESRSQTTTLVVQVRQPSDEPLPILAMVRVVDPVNKLESSVAADQRRGATFHQVPPGRYRVEVAAAGFARTSEEITLPLPDDAHGTLTVYLRPERPAGATAESWVPPLPTRAGNEFARAIESTRKGDWKEASKRVDRVLRMAPGNPEVNYLVGVYYLRQKKLDLARPFLVRAAYLNPTSVSAASALGGLLYSQRDYPGALPVLEQAATLQPSSWELQWTAASAAYRISDFVKATTHSSRAFSLGGTVAPRTELLLAYSLAAAGQLEEAAQHARGFLSKRVEPEAAQAAEQIVRIVNPSSAPNDKTPGLSLDAAVAVALAPPTLLEPHLPSRLWAPPDVDDEIPTVSQAETCSLPAVLDAAGKRVVNLVDNLQRIGATETIEHAQIDAFGKAGASERRKTGYAVEIRQIRPGQLALEEYRDLSFTQEVSASHPLAHGLGALALIFHPFYSGEFEMSCEGVGTWNGTPAWQIHFKQRPGRPSLHGYKANGNIYDADLKGRAFIGVDNFEIIHLEMDVMEPLPQIGLSQEHMSVDYGEVGFPKKQTKFWIPTKADLYINLHGHLHHLQHSFADFILFSVDATEQQLAPKQAQPKPEEQDPPQKP